MTVLRTTFAFIARGSNFVGCTVTRNSSTLTKFNGKPMKMFSATCLTMSNMQNRSICSQDITKNIQYISNEKNLNLISDPKTLKLEKPIEKPLCIMLCWLLARQKHLMKYADYYVNRGFDVLSVSVTPWQLLWPMKGSQLVAADLLRFMHNNTSFNPLVVHGFSVGGYMWGEMMMHASTDMQKYQKTFDRIVAQVWDSAADISEIKFGVPSAVFPKNKVMENALRKYIEYHMKTFHEAATIHYMRSSQEFHRNRCHAPALFFLSKSDKIGAERSNKKVCDTWDSIGIKTTWKCWDKSPHVQHYLKHTPEYLAMLNEHLDGAGLASQTEKVQVRL